MLSDSPFTRGLEQKTRWRPTSRMGKRFRTNGVHLRENSANLTGFANSLGSQHACCDIVRYIAERTWLVHDLGRWMRCAFLTDIVFSEIFHRQLVQNTITSIKPTCFANSGLAQKSVDQHSEPWRPKDLRYGGPRPAETEILRSACILQPSGPG